MEREHLEILQTAIFLLEGVSDADLMLRYNLLHRKKKAEKIVDILKS